MSAHPGAASDVASVLRAIERPKRAVVTAGMPYANGPLHLGHLAGAHLPPDIYARWLGMLIGRQNVLFVCGTDEHGSTSDLAALQAGKPIRQFVDEVHDAQRRTLDRFEIGLDIYSGTSRPECFPVHRDQCHEILLGLHRNGLLQKRTTRQWYDPKAQRFLPDRYVRGRCPNPKCDNQDAYSDECDRCGHQHRPEDLIAPRSTISDGVPELRETAHLWLDMEPLSDMLQSWIASKAKTWRASVLSEVRDRVMPSLRIAKEHESPYKQLKASLPKHVSKYAPGKQVILQFGNKADAKAARAALAEHGIDAEHANEWAHRPISRDIAWGIPLPPLDPELAGKTLYVWPDSLIAPISFTRLALSEQGLDPARYVEYWCDPDARIYQFVGQDNVFFYVLMQGALWLGSQQDYRRMPIPGELQLTDVFGCFHLLVGGEKMSKSRGNFFTGDQLLDEKGYTVDQIRYYLALLGLPEKPSDFDFGKLDDRNKFLAGPMNAAFERPISAAHSKFGGRVPAGVLAEKVQSDTTRMVQRYVRAMERGTYPNMLFELENYARTINSLFTQYKPHDDRQPLESRANALHTAFYVLKNLMIMLYPFVPSTMERLRESLRLPSDVFRVEQLGTPIPAGHELGPQQQYFPPVPAAMAATASNAD